MLKAKVVRRKKGQDMVAVQKVAELPTLAQALEMREMEVANQPKASPMLTADTSSSTNMLTADTSSSTNMLTAKGSRMTVKKKKSGAKPGDDVYDPRIEGGYGKSMGPKESGEQAVQRIMKVKRKGK
jgi:hypothetical protein